MSRQFVLGCLLLSGIVLSGGCGGGKEASPTGTAPAGVQLKERPLPPPPGGGEAPPAKKGKAAAGGNVGVQ
jgi:hypothetical protein